MNTQLPSEFSDLEQFAPWALPTSVERNKKRVESSMDEINAFYDAMLPRAEKALAYLDQFSLQEMPQDAQRLMFLTLSLAEVSIAVVSGRMSLSEVPVPVQVLPAGSKKAPSLSSSKTSLLER